MTAIRSFFGCLLAGCMAAPAMVAAEPVTQASIQVSASVVAGCLITSGSIESDLNGRTDVVWGSLDFGTVPAAGNAGSAEASLTWNTGIRVRCTPGIPLAMRVNGGLNDTRLLKLTTGSLVDSVPAPTLQYYLYSEPAMTAASEIPLNTPVDISDVDHGDVIFPIYARVMLPEVSASGTYTDTVRVTLEW